MYCICILYIYVYICTHTFYAVHTRVASNMFGGRLHLELHLFDVDMIYALASDIRERDLSGCRNYGPVLGP